MTTAKSFTVHVIDIYNVSVVICPWAKAKAVAKSRGYCLDCTNLSNRQGTVLHSTGVYPLLILPVIPKSAKELGVLAHECIHAVNFIFEDMGEASRDEVYAHAVGSLFTSILERCRHGVHK